MKKSIELEKSQWEMIERCVCLVLQQVENLQYGFTPPLPPVNYDTKELCRIRSRLSYGYAEKGEGVHESIIRSKAQPVEPTLKPSKGKLITGNTLAKIYNVSFDHQIEPRDYGNFSTFDKARDYLLEDMGLKVIDIVEYKTVTIYKTGHGDYRIEEKSLNG